MLPEISEFSYGFALTNEIVGWMNLSVAPIFPSLLEEGKAGGGYDVKLDRPGTPLFLQFKRSECMVQGTAREAQKVSKMGGKLAVPFYRFNLTESAKSDQHEMLLALDTGNNQVFYAAPRFHRRTEINHAWQNRAVASRSTFVRPRTIGSVDPGRHTIAFDGMKSWVCSDPREIDVLTSRQVLEALEVAINNDPRPMRNRLPEIVGELEDAVSRGHERIREKEMEAARRAAEMRKRGGPVSEELDGLALSAFTHSVELQRLETPEPAPPPTRSPKPIDPQFAALRRAADLASTVFDAQLVVVQPTK